jgi:hypothetical protein
MPASWNSYGGGEAILLAIVLLMVAADLAWPANGCGPRLRSLGRAALPRGS